MATDMINISGNTTPLTETGDNDADQMGYYPNAKPVGMIILLSCIATIFANIVLLKAYWNARDLHTPFNVYIINLSLGDLIQAAGNGWSKMELYYTNGWQFGRTACTLQIYLDWITCLFLFHLHLLISINRLWAICSPLTYKVYHNKKVAIFSCMFLWAYSHAWILPAVIPDALYYREDSTLDCSINSAAQPGWNSWCTYIGYILPMLLIIIIYPVICWKFHKYKKAYFGSKLTARIAPLQLATVSRSQDTNTMPKPSTALTSTVESGHWTMTKNANSTRKYTQNPAKVFHFRVISCLVIGVITCWMPLCSYFVAVAIYPSYNNFIHISVATVLYFFNPLLNPLMYPLASKEWRQAFLRLLKI